MRLKLGLYVDILILLRNLLNCYYSCYLPPETICMVKKKEEKKHIKSDCNCLQKLPGFFGWFRVEAEDAGCVA